MSARTTGEIAMRGTAAPAVETTTDGCDPRLKQRIRRSEKMRILHLINHCNYGNGSVHVAVDLACAQAKMGHTVIYAGNGGDYLQLLADHGVKCERLVQRDTNPLRLIASLAKLMNICASFKPDIIHAHMMAGAVFGKTASVLFRTPLVTTVHNSFDSHSFLMKLGDKVAAVSDAERNLLIGRGYDPKKVEVVLNGPIGSPRESLLEKLDAEVLRDIQQPFVTTVCGLHPRKGVQDLIGGFSRVAAAHPAWKLYIVGDGPQLQELIELTRTLDIADRVIFLGYVKNPGEILSKADIFVLASHAEPFGLATAEARHAGCAIIGTSVGGTPELLDFGKAGLLVEPGSPDAIAAALERLMSDPTMLLNFRANAKNGSERYQAARVAEDYSRLYGSLMPGTSG
jgi:glycosyltransferase involved in cell wall biosynthesis